MDKQALINNLEDEYKRFIDRVAMLSPMEIIARADLVAAYHFVLDYIKSEDFQLSDVAEDTSEIDLEDCESIMDSLADTFRFEADVSRLHDDINYALGIVFRELLSEQASEDIRVLDADDEELEP